MLINVLAGLGHRWEAIEIYERLHDGLDEAYAAEPEPETKALYRRLLTGAQKRLGPACEEQMRAIRGFFLQPFVSLLIAEQLAKIGRIDNGLEIVYEALASASHDRYWCDAELERLRGDLLLAKGVDEQHAEAAYRRAIQIAQKQQAKLFELRATTHLAQLLLKQGKSTESRQLLTQRTAGSPKAWKRRTSRMRRHC